MSGAELPNPSPHQEPESSPIPPDPLLDSGSFLDPDRPKTQQSEQSPYTPFPPGTVIAAVPISMVAPEDVSSSAPKAATRRSAEEMAKRPNWLPNDWKIELKVRSSGATTGLIDREIDLNVMLEEENMSPISCGIVIDNFESTLHEFGFVERISCGHLGQDYRHFNSSEETSVKSSQELNLLRKSNTLPEKNGELSQKFDPMMSIPRMHHAFDGFSLQYYIEPSGERKFRSKNEVLHFLETGSKRKKSSNSEADIEPSGNPGSEKQKQPKVRRKKGDALNSGIIHPSNANAESPKKTPQKS